MTPEKNAAAIDRLHTRAEQHYGPPSIPAGVVFDPEDRRMLSPDGEQVLVEFLDVHCAWSPAYTISKATLDRPNKVTVTTSLGPRYTAADRPAPTWAPGRTRSPAR